MSDAMIEVRDLVKHFPLTEGIIFRRQVGAVRAVDGVSFDVNEGETLGLVGESGCGKSTTARLVTRLLEPTSGAIIYRGRDIAHLSRRELKPLRRDMQMIFQDPYSSLNPRKTVGSIIGEPFVIHGVESDKGRRKTRVAEQHCSQCAENCGREQRRAPRLRRKLHDERGHCAGIEIHAVRRERSEHHGEEHERCDRS